MCPFYLDDQSEPDEGHYVWAYHVEIVNNGNEQVQLRTRYWRITDALGRVQEVRGPGVVASNRFWTRVTPLSIRAARRYRRRRALWRVSTKWNWLPASGSMSKYRHSLSTAPIKRSI